MAEQIECVGGPLDRCNWIKSAGEEFEFRRFEVFENKVVPHIYHYNHQSNTYEYKGVRK